MRKFVFSALWALLSSFTLAQKYEYAVITSVESIVPMGVGRSRIIHHKDKKDAKALTTSRVEGVKDKDDDVERSDAKMKTFDETMLLNFYSATGINFSNIAANDAIISSKINNMIDEGWELAFVASGVESDSGKDDGKGIFITRYIFRRPRQ
ncbi:MAG: hypothetical protein NZM38_10885 [Cytophagales bacterium]|nr:hypothetical protein [Cytophagales bacterium]MDW8385259.1 hypothetical protein [Flammeovirgaceae bacterium]